MDIVSVEMVQQHETRKMMMNPRETKWSQHECPKKGKRGKIHMANAKVHDMIKLYERERR